MKTQAIALALILVSLSVAFAAQPIRTETRYDDIVYLDEAKAKPLPLKTIRRVALTVSRDQSTVLAYLAKGETVWVLGFGQGRHYVETMIPTGKARGWIDEEALEPAPGDVRSTIEERVLTARRHKEMISKHEIEVGMTKTQVQAALGKPEDRSRIEDGDQVEEQWVYRSYKSVPQKDYYYVDGQMYERMFYKKVQAGGKTVTFRNDQVVAIKDEDRKPEETTPTITVPPPVIYGY